MDFSKIKDGQYLVLGEKALWAAAAHFYNNQPPEKRTKEMDPRPQDMEVSIFTHIEHDNILHGFPRIAGFVLSTRSDYHVELVYHLSLVDTLGMTGQIMAAAVLPSEHESFKKEDPQSMDEQCGREPSEVCLPHSTKGWR